jgi:SAM-dependent methyltransferase
VVKPYQHLSQVYDFGWGDFSKQYVALVKELLQERNLAKAKILDIACGTGILAIELAKCGYFVHGIDISPEMISVAKSKSVRLSNLSFDIQDMVRFSIDVKFDLVMCTFDSINYLRELNDLRKTFLRVASVLYEGGLFIFDSNTKQLYLSHSDEVHKRELNGHSFIEHCSYDPIRNTATTAFSFSDGTYEIHKQRPYDYDELYPLLKCSGFHTVHLFSWFEKMPYSVNTPKLFCVAEKRSSPKYGH